MSLLEVVAFMKNIYKAQYGNITVRFAMRDGDLYVSWDDIALVFEDFSPEYAKKVALEEGLSIVADSQDQTAIVVDVDTIGKAVNVFAVGTLISSLAALASEHDKGLLEIGIPAQAAFKWYFSVISDANDYFDRGLGDIMASAIKRMDRVNPALPVNITYSEGVYTAVCNELYLVTESKSLDELQELVWDLAPDLIDLNDLDIDPENLRLSFLLEQSINEHRLVN